MCTGFEADWSRSTISVTHYLVVWPKTSYLTLLIPVFSSVKWESDQSCFCDPMGCSPPVFSVSGIFQARILEWVAISYSRGSSQPRDWTCISWISCTGEWILYHCATWEAQKMRIISPYFIWLLWRLNEIVYAQELNELLQFNLCGTTPSVRVILR